MIDYKVSIEKIENYFRELEFFIEEIEVILK